MHHRGLGTLYSLHSLASFQISVCADVCFVTDARTAVRRAGAAERAPVVPGAGPRMPASAPQGFSYYTPPNLVPRTIQTPAELVGVRLEKHTQINRCVPADAPKCTSFIHCYRLCFSPLLRPSSSTPL